MSSLFGIGGGGNVGAAGGFYSYSIDQSLRFEESGAANLTRTPSSAATDNKKFTFSVWIKRGQNSPDDQHIIQSKNTGSGTGQGHVGLLINTADKINVYSENGGFSATSIRVLRCYSAWYHICFVYDTTQSTSTDRIKIYINGEQATLTGGFPALNSVMSSMNYNGQEQYIGKYVSGFTRYFNGYMAEMHMVDGTALDPTSFGETINGIWVPKQYSGSYGTNGFYLSFADSAAIGDDLSGNTNDWTANNLAASDVVPDSPTNNFCTWNVLQPTSAAQGVMTLSEGNLKATGGSSIYRQIMGNMSVLGGKWYTEFYITDAGYPSWQVGWTKATRYEAFTGSATESTHLANFGDYGTSNGYVSTFGQAHFGTTYAYSGLWSGARAPTTGDVIGCAADFDNGKLWWSINGEWINIGAGAGDPANGTNPSATYTASDYADDFKTPHYLNYNGSAVLNTGQDSTFAGNTTAGGNSDENGVGDFKYSVPSGFLALASSSLPEPAIGPNSDTTSDQHFNTVLYTGNGTSQSITGVGFQPDFLWIKDRTQGSSVYNHTLVDSVRDTEGWRYLSSNTTDAEGYNNTLVSSLDTDGFSVGSALATNNSGSSVVAWNWKAGGTAVSNTDGSITSSVSANQDAGFSIVSFTCGSGVTSGTVGHGLGVQPQLIIGKTRNHAVGWYIHTPLLAANLTGAFDTAAWYDPGYNHWNDTHPTDTVFSVGGYMAGHADLTSPSTKICYCFANVEGHQKVGLYVGNGNADGTFVYTGFRPAFVLLKKTSAAGDNWSMYDNKRDTDNTVREYIIPNQSAAAASTDTMDFVSNGFKVRNSGAYINTSGATYIYLAFAEAPFKYANAR